MTRSMSMIVTAIGAFLCCIISFNVNGVIGSSLSLTPPIPAKSEVDKNLPSQLTAAENLYTFTVRLLDCNGKESTQSGRVEVWYKTGWGTVCGDTFTHTEASVICYSLGYQRNKAIYTYQAYGGPSDLSLPIKIASLKCNGTEISMDYCQHSQWETLVDHCDHNMDVSVACDPANNIMGGKTQIMIVCRRATVNAAAVRSTAAVGKKQTMTGYPVRLSDRTGTRSGRLEIFFDGEWGTVCDDYFSDTDAHVACGTAFNTVTFKFTGVYVGSKLGADVPSRIWLSLLNCTGEELNPGNCPHVAWGVSTCNHNQDVYISCTQITTSASEDQKKLRESLQKKRDASQLIRS